MTVVVEKVDLFVRLQFLQSFDSIGILANIDYDSGALNACSDHVHNLDHRKPNSRNRRCYICSTNFY